MLQKSKIKKGDQVIVIAGKDKGRKGTVLRVREADRGCVKVLVEGVNLVKKHVKPNPHVNESGGVKEIESWINSSNVMILNPVSKRGERVGYRFLENGRKVRYFKVSKEIVDRD
jgi:large subunit ribosomal protein L24